MDELNKLRKKISELEKDKRLFKETEKKLQAANQQLQVSRQQLESKQETLMRTQRIAHVGSWEWDVASDTVSWSDELFQIFRLDPEKGAVSYSDHPKIYAPESMLKLDKAVQQTLETGEPYKVDLEIVRGDGTNAFCTAQGYAKKDKKGKVIRLYGSLQDITERKNAEEELKKSEERLKIILDNNPFPIAVVDEADQQIQYWSKSAIQLFGHNPKTVEEWYQLAYPNPEYRQQVIERWKPFLETAQNAEKAVNTGEYEIHCKDGSVKICEIYAQFLPDALIVTLNDITERKQSEEQLKALNQQLVANEQQLRAANDLLQSHKQQLIASNQQLEANEQQLRATNESLIASEEQYRNLFNSMQEGVYLHSMVYDDQGKAINYRIIEANPISEKYLNIKREDAIGKLATELYETKEAPFLKIYSKVAETGAPVSFEQYFEPMDKYFLISAFSPKKGEFATAFLDISDKKRVEISLTRANKELNKVQEISHMGSFSIDFATNEVKWTEELYKIYGFDPALPPPLLNESQTLFTPESWELLSTSIAKTAETGDPYEIELNTSLEDGKTGWLWARGEANINADGKITGIWGAVQDITERKHAEEILQKSEEKFKSIFENKGTASGIFGEDSIIKDCNALFAEMSGYSKSEIIDKMKWSDFVVKEDLERLQKYHSQRIINGNPPPSKYECSIINKSGELISVIVNVALIGEDRIVSLTDITELKLNENAIVESNQLIEGIMNSIPIRLFWKDMNLVYLGCNKIFAQDAGFANPKEIIGKDDYEMGWRDQAELYQSDDRQVIESGIPKYQIEEPQTTPEGKLITLLTSKIPLRNPQGEIYGLLGTYMDITERKKAEELLRESEERFKALHNASFGGISIHDKGIILECNQGLSAMTGYSREELIGMDGLLLIAPNSRELIKKNINIGYKKPYEAFGLRKNGEIFPMLLEGRNIPYKGKSVRVVEFRDITEQKQVGLKLKESEERFRSLVTNLPVGIFRSTLEGEVLSANPALIEMYGYESLDDLLNVPANKYYADENPREKMLAALKKEGFLLDYETLEKKKDGTIIWVSSNYILMSSDNGETNYIDGVCIDVTERKLVQEELLIAKEKAIESDRLKSAFLANMSHEIRTPMNGILGFSSLLKEPKLTGEQQQKYIGIIEKSGTRMLNIINDIVDISKIEAGLMNLDIKESNINEQIEYIYTFFKPEVEAKGMKLSYKNTLPAREATIKTDREKVFAILTNLVKNAIKYTNKGSIEFGYNKKDNFIEFFVKDTGIGIPKNRQEAIFERFIQADIDDVQARQGAGLGLSISKAYVEMLDGKIWAVSEEGKGSNFYFTIPYHEVFKKETSHDTIDVDDDLLRLNLKILIVEDDEISCKLLSIFADKYVKEIISVTNGNKALEACRNNPDIDLILMDIQLPEMNGYEATRQIRAFNKEVIIIAQTAYGLSGDREKAIKAGCNDYISKPVKKEIFDELIQAYFKKEL